MAAAVVKSAVSKATGGIKRTIRVPLEFGTEHGHQIFVYHNIQTHQIVYSLTRTMKNNLALHQLPFAGKKTVPPSLRKDHWTPLCVLSFPHADQGLHAYSRLREYKHLHEVAWDPSTMLQTKGPHAGHWLLPRKERGKKIQNQKANSIADMAAVLASQARAPTEEEIRSAKFFVRRDGRPVAKKGAGSKRSCRAIEFQGRIEGTSVWWADMLDAEFAETWPVQVVHGRLAVYRGTAVWPPPEDYVSREHEVVKDEGDEAARERVMEERRALLRRSEEVDVKEKMRIAEEMMTEARRREEEAKEGKGVGSWFESTRRLFPAMAGQRAEVGAAATA